ncbi:MAG: hypothetical protein ACYDGY_08370 [Acidimicrobiales bacterium]
MARRRSGIGEAESEQNNPGEPESRDLVDMQVPDEEPAGKDPAKENVSDDTTVKRSLPAESGPDPDIDDTSVNGSKLPAERRATWPLGHRGPGAGNGTGGHARPGSGTRTGNNLVKEAVNRIDDKERRYGFIAAVVAAVLWLLLTVPILVHPAKPHKGQLGTDGVAIYLLVGLLLAGLIFFSSWTRRRALLGFTVLFTGFSFGADLLFAIPFYFLGAWLIWRAMRIQREAQAALRAAGISQSSPTRARERSASPWRRRKKESAEGGKRAPAASKRYTPPRSAAQSSKRRTR